MTTFFGVCAAVSFAVFFWFFVRTNAATHLTAEQRYSEAMLSIYAAIAVVLFVLATFGAWIIGALF